MTLARALSASLALALTFTAARADARAYPTNTCVAGKQTAAARYCYSALRAWSDWDVSQDSADRDADLVQAATRLAFSWSRAEARASTSNIDCVETTIARPALVTQIDSAIAGIVGEINDGLNLASSSDARCGQRLLRAAATKCSKILRGHGRHMKALERDPLRTLLATEKLKASGRFNLAWASVLGAGCPTAADQNDIEDRVDAIVDDTVFDTSNSPNVDDTQFTTYTAPDPVEYQGRTFNATCMNDSPYAYFAKRGTVNKLLVYYQGGGACWEQLGCQLPACDTNVNPMGSDNPNNQSVGFGDRNNPLNPFRDWNIVFVSYCSCDIHFGDAAQDYGPLHVEHRGYHNSRIVEKWAREHFVDPEMVFVTGSSAGAYGAWFNAPLHQEVWPASEFVVLADAGNGVITADFLNNYFPNWNFAANIPDTIPGLLEVLTGGTGIPGYTEVVANFFPRTRWAHYSSSYDGGFGGQSSFYNIMLNNNNVIAALSWWEASCAFNAQMRTQAIDTYAAVPSNYRYYIGTGSRHTMWGSNKVYTDTTGGVPTILDWVNGMIDGTPAWSNVECTNCGLTILDDPVPDPLEAPFEQQGPDVVVNCGP